MSTPFAYRSPRVAILLCVLAVISLQRATGGQGAADAVHADLQARFETQVEPGLAGRSQFTFAVTGDIHLSPRDVRVLTRQTWQDLLGRWRDAGHLFGVVVGDLGFGEAQGIADVVDGWAAVPNAPPIYYTMGNHELDAPMGKRAWIDALYPGAVAPSSWTPTTQLPGNSDRAYWAFDVGPFWRFIILDGDHRTTEGAGTMGTLGFAQLDWLALDLHANADRNVMVFIHEPIDQPKYDTAEFTLNDRGALLDVLAGHPKQKFLFSGHLHSYRGITKWRGVTSVHTSEPGADGVRVAVDGETATVSWPGMTAADTVDYDQHPMYQVVSDGVTRTLRVGEENGDYGRTRTKRMTVVGAENGVTPRHGSLMLKAGPVTWYDQWYISEQLVKIVPGMKFSYDVWLSGVVDGQDAVVVQPNWVTADGSRPAQVSDQNGLALSRHTRDGSNSRYYDDLPRLGGRATGQWYHREIDLTPLAGSYADGVSMAAAAMNVNVGTVYVDNIAFTWPQSASTGGDTVPPFLSGVAASGATSSSVAIAWATDEPASSQVDYGPTTSYGQSSFGAALVTNHSRTLGLLMPSTLYHFRVRSRDAAGNLSISPDFTFQTSVAPGGPSGLLAHWPLDAGSGTTAEDLAGGYTGTLTNGAQWTTGKVSGGVHLDGVDDYIDVPDLVMDGAGLTLSAWVNTSSFSSTSHQRFISKASGAAEQDHMWMLGHTIINGVQRLRFRLKTGATTTTLIASGGDLPLNTWYHAAATYDGSTMRLYLGGVLVGSVAKTGLIPANPAVPVNIGRNPDGTNPVHGSLDEVRVYGRALTTAEIAEVMAYTGPPVDSTPPVVNVTSPAAGQVIAGIVPLAATATDESGTVESVQFFVNGTAVGAPDTTVPFAVSWDTTAASGPQVVTAVARDAAGNTTTSAVINVTVDNAAPTVAVTSPAAGVVAGTVAISASASDSEGVASVQFRIDGVDLGAPDTTAPYDISWNTTSVTNAAHVITAVARDALGNVATSPAVTVTVDNATPAVAVTSPAAGVVAGTITVSASASDSGGVASVQFRVDGVNLGAADTTAPYSVSWNTTSATNAAHVITAVAADAAGNLTTSAAVTVTVDNAAPSVAVTSPAAGVVAGTIALSATASDSGGIASVQFRVDGVNLGAADTTAPYGVSWTTTTATNAAHVITAVARDLAGNVTTSAGVTVTVDNAAPTVAVTAPPGGTVAGTVTMTATASDSGGIASVQFRVDGVNLGAADTTSPYSVAWNTTGVANGSHALTAVARDAAGNTTTSAAVTVTVSNWVPPAGLVAAYAFNEASGTTTGDASGNGRTGTLSGGATRTTGGMFGAALDFNGSSGLVTIADAAAFDFTTGMTIEAWVRPTSRSNWDTIVMKRAGSSRAYSLYAGDSGGRAAGTLRIGGSDRTVTGATLPLNVWSHVALTYNGSTIRLYVNGAQVDSRSNTGSILTSSDALTIGGNSSFGRWFAGRIDEVRFYNRALSQTEIQAGMNRSVVP